MLNIRVIVEKCMDPDEVFVQSCARRGIVSSFPTKRVVSSSMMWHTYPIHIFKLPNKQIYRKKELDWYIGGPS
jgi:hypothetical protein